MSEEKKALSRRGFLGTGGVALLGSMLPAQAAILSSF